MHQHPVRALLIVAAAGIALVAAAPAAAATITICVKSKSGEVRFRSGAAAKKKCAKGWKRVRWSTTGKKGAAGIPGIPGLPGTAGAPGQQGLTAPAFSIKDATGATVGALVGFLPQGFPFYSVLREGGVFQYLGSGEAFSLGSPPPKWKANDCSGTAYLTASGSLTPATWAKLFSGPFRTLFRTLSPAGVFGPTSAWKGSGALEAVVATQLYSRNSTTGVCAPDGGAFSGDLVRLDPVPAPPDFVGPLTLG